MNVRFNQSIHENVHLFMKLHLQIRSLSTFIVIALSAICNNTSSHLRNLTKEEQSMTYIRINDAFATWVNAFVDNWDTWQYLVIFLISIQYSMQKLHCILSWNKSVNLLLEETAILKLNLSMRNTIDNRCNWLKKSN